MKMQTNGLIFEKETGKVIAMCQRRFSDVGSYEDVIDIVHKSDNCRVEYCEDGTIVRLYYYGGKWRTATTRCIDGNDSYWSSSKNFDSLFWQIYDTKNLDILDKNYTYVFILLHRENRIVVRHNVNMLVYVSRIDNTSHIEDYNNVFKKVYGIKRPKMMDLYEFGKLSSNVNNYDCKFKRGLLVKVYNLEKKQWDLFKYDFETYKMVKSIRGNVPQLRMRYLELLNKPESLMLLEQFYTEQNFMFTFIKASLLKLVKTVYKLYVESHIKHTVKVDEDNMYYRTLKQLHAQYKVTNKSISFSDVQEKIYSLDKMVIKKLLGWV